MINKILTYIKELPTKIAVDFEVENYANPIKDVRTIKDVFITAALAFMLTSIVILITPSFLILSLTQSINAIGIYNFIATVIDAVSLAILICLFRGNNSTLKFASFLVITLGVIFFLEYLSPIKMDMTGDVFKSHTAPIFSHFFISTFFIYFLTVFIEEWIKSAKKTNQSIN